MLKSQTSFNDENRSLANDEKYYEELDFSIQRKKSSILADHSQNFIQNFDFRSKLTKDAIKGLSAERSKSFIGSQKNGPELNYWKIKPPDFRYSQFDPKPMSAKEKARMKQENVKDMKAKPSKPKSAPVLTLHAKEFLQQQPQYVQEKTVHEFKRKFQVLQPQEDRIISLKNCITNTNPYRDPKEHDFRQYLPPSALGLPNFTAVKESDPMDFKRELLKHRLQRSAYKVKKTVFRDVDPGLQIGDKVLTPAPTYEPNLQLPKGDYPPKHEEFTRYRRLGRSVRSAFMEKVERELSRKWENDWKERIEYLERLNNIELKKRLLADQRNNHSRSQTSTYSMS